MKRTHLIIRVSEDERAMIEKGASIRRRTVSDYLRWLVFVDHDAKYRLTPNGRDALEASKEQGDH